MIRTTLKSVALSLIVLVMVVVVLVAVDNAAHIDVAQKETGVRVQVVDLNDNPVHNASVSVCGENYFTDNKGLSPAIQLSQPKNSYDANVTEWYTVNLTVKKEGFVPAVVINCVVYDGQTRKLTVKIYPVDSSNLPFVCYVESPPSSYITQMLGSDA